MFVCGFFFHFLIYVLCRNNYPVKYLPWNTSTFCDLLWRNRDQSEGQVSHWVGINSASYFYSIQSLLVSVCRSCGTPFQLTKLTLTVIKIKGVTHERTPWMVCGTVFGWMHRVVHILVIHFLYDSGQVIMRNICLATCSLLLQSCRSYFIAFYSKSRSLFKQQYYFILIFYKSTWKLCPKTRIWRDSYWLVLNYNFQHYMNVEIKCCWYS